MISSHNSKRRSHNSKLSLVVLFALTVLISSQPALAEKVCLKSSVKNGKVTNSVVTVASSASCPKKSVKLFDSNALTEFSVGLDGVEIVGGSHSVTLSGGGGFTSFSMNCPTGKAVIGHLCREPIGEFLVDPLPAHTFADVEGSSFTCQFYNGIGSQATHTVQAFAICASVG